MRPPLGSKLVNEIQRLQAARQAHVDALRAIDQVLGGVAQTLAEGDDDRVVPKEARASNESPDALLQIVPASVTSARPVFGVAPVKYCRLSQTGEEFVLSFVRERGSPTTFEINFAWRAQGRGGVANNALGRLLKRGLLLRVPLGERRGSQYRVAPRPESSGGASPRHEAHRTVGPVTNERIQCD